MERLPLALAVLLLCGCPGFHPHFPPWEKSSMDRMARFGRGEQTDEKRAFWQRSVPPANTDPFLEEPAE